ncbi:hypothetical protein BaRGS_00023001 [Batillaria attramentaria]|uniref:Mutator-like transposase domain-containing protein n=1 Tax=Batillaria attramentaria TaxID=370345 RepID=A0ABD0KF04_9CAEN
MWNAAYQGHIELGTCARPHFHVGDERKIGLVVQQKLKCANCDFVTPFHALYDERDTAKRGRKAACLAWLIHGTWGRHSFQWDTKHSSAALFPHHTTQAEKRKAQIILAADLVNRSQCIFDHVHRACQGEASKMKKVLPKVVETVLNCYAGDCSDCKNFCRGTCHGSDGKSWWEKSYDLSVSGIHSLNVSSSDRCVMKTVLDMKLGETESC